MLRRISRWLIPLFVGGVLGVGAGFAGDLFFFPILFPPPAAHEQVADMDSQTKIGQAMFIHTNPSDPGYYGEGNATIFRDQTGAALVHLESDFKVGPGPKFHVYLVDHGAVLTAADVKNSKWLDLGQLRAFEGSQNYAIPADVKLADYKSIVIWCETFGVLISPATIQSVSA
jgi:hypothetical protein